jgi:hypothetical protein
MMGGSGWLSFAAAFVRVGFSAVTAGLQPRACQMERGRGTLLLFMAVRERGNGVECARVDARRAVANCC